THTHRHIHTHSRNVREDNIKLSQEQCAQHTVATSEILTASALMGRAHRCSFTSLLSATSPHKHTQTHTSPHLSFIHRSFFHGPPRPRKPSTGVSTAVRAIN